MESKRDLSCRLSPINKRKREEAIMETSTPTTSRRESQLIVLEDESPIKWGATEIIGSSLTNKSINEVAGISNGSSGAENSQMIPKKAGISNDMDSTVLSKYLEPSPDTMDKRLAGAAMDITDGAKIKQIVPELVGEETQESPIDQNVYKKIMKAGVSQKVKVGVKKISLGLNAPLELLNSIAVAGGSGKKRPIPMDIDNESIGSPLKKTRKSLFSYARNGGGNEVKQQLSRRDSISTSKRGGGSPALRQREGLLSANDVNGPPKTLPGVDEVKQQLRCDSVCNQKKDGGHRKACGSRKQKPDIADSPTSEPGKVPSRSVQPLISAFMSEKSKDSVESQSQRKHSL